MAAQKTLTEHWIDIRRYEVAVRDDAPLWVDVLEFQRLLDQVKDHQHTPDIVCEHCLPSLLEAIDLYQGDFLRGFTLPDCPAFDEWHAFQTDLLREKLIECFRKIIQYAASQGDLTQAIDYARRWVAGCPWSEAAHRELMRVYALNHQRSAALQQYQDCVRILREEFEAEPEHETQELYKAILNERVPGINARSESSSRLKPTDVGKPALEGALASLRF